MIVFSQEPKADSQEPPETHRFPSAFQFERTRAIRAAVYRIARLSLRKRILDVGAGEGLVAGEMASRTGRPCFALDVAPEWSPPPFVRGITGDAQELPIADATLDAISYHFVLLWIRDPRRALREAFRALKPGGVVMILAEPDLASRVDEPDTGLGRAIVRSVEDSGGHADAGSRVEVWLRDAGFRADIGSTGVEWAALSDPSEAEHELAFLRERAGLSSEELRRMADLEQASAAAGTRRVLLPLYSGVGFKPGRTSE